MQVLFHQLEVASLHHHFKPARKVLLCVRVKVRNLVCELWDAFRALGEVLVSAFELFDVNL